MAVHRIEAYQTSDGRLHLSRPEAAEHDLNRAVLMLCNQDAARLAAVTANPHLDRADGGWTHHPLAEAILMIADRIREVPAPVTEAS